jgi:hypothetical protein
MKVCIASSKGPTAATFAAFIDAVKAEAAKREITITSYRIVPGSGCANHGIELHGPDEGIVSEFMNAFTYALMPAQWRIMNDNDPGVGNGRFEYAI